MNADGPWLMTVALLTFGFVALAFVRILPKKRKKPLWVRWRLQEAEWDEWFDRNK